MENSYEQNGVLGWLLDDTIPPDAKLRQGDLVTFEGEQDSLRKIGVVVTADCDLQQSKHARLVTLVPIVDAKTVLERYLLLEDCERKRELIEAYMFRKFEIDMRQDRETKLILLKQTSEASGSNGDEIVQEGVGFVLGAYDTISIAGYRELMNQIGSKPKGRNAFRDQIRGRGDLLVLPSAKQFGISGQIAWLRHIWQVGVSDIALRTSEVADRPGERLGRLASPFRYRLTQLMAQVFSDIGLPDISDGMDVAIEEVYGDV